MSERAPTIHDVAREASVSTATVSRVLNGGSVRADTAAAVHDAVRRLGYLPNRVARGLVTGRSDVVGVLVPDLVGPLNAAVARGVEDALEARGLHAVVTTDHRDARRERARMRSLVARRVDGLVLIGSQLHDDAIRATVGSTPVVHVGAEREPDPLDDPIPEVRVDNRAGTDAALRLLARAGHVRIAHLAGPRRDGREREVAVHDGARVLGLELVACQAADFSEAGGLEAGRILLDTGGFSAVVCANDRSAVGLYAAARERGLRLPDDLSIVGFDDLPWSAYLDPALTTVRHPSREMGRVAAERLFAVDGADAWRGLRTLSPDLTERASVASPSSPIPAPTGAARTSAHPPYLARKEDHS